MRVALSFHGLSEAARAVLRAIVNARAHHLERRLAAFAPDRVRMEARIEEGSAHRRYRVSLRLKLPSTVWVASAEDYDLRGALAEAFEDLERCMERHFARSHRVPVRRHGVARAQSARLGHAP